MSKVPRSKAGAQWAAVASILSTLQIYLLKGSEHGPVKFGYTQIALEIMLLAIIL